MSYRCSHHELWQRLRIFIPFFDFDEDHFGAEVHWCWFFLTLIVRVLKIPCLTFRAYLSSAYVADSPLRRGWRYRRAWGCRRAGTKGIEKAEGIEGNEGIERIEGSEGSKGSERSIEHLDPVGISIRKVNRYLFYFSWIPHSSGVQLQNHSERHSYFDNR